jgi:hypothetical protein
MIMRKSFSSLRWAVMIAALLSFFCGTAMAGQPPRTLLQILWECKPTANDWMTSHHWTEASGYDMTGGGQIAYVLSAQVTGTRALYGLYKSSIPDHMDSNTSNEGGYSNLGVLGYPWTSSAANRTVFHRYYNSSTRDHATVCPTAGQSLGSGYADEGDMGDYCCGRFGSVSESLLSISAGGVTIQSNKVAGGAIWTWTWNGKEFVNDWDHGRQIQSALTWYDLGKKWNPTEAGDTYGNNPVARRHGSPWAIFQNNSSAQQQTQSVPLEWLPWQVSGGGDDCVVAYMSMRLGKQIDLNFNGMGPVVKYQTQIYTDVATSGATTVEAPTGYLNYEFHRYWSYDATSTTLKETTNMDFTPASGYGGVIISDSTTNYAMGCYGALTSQGGSFTKFQLMSFPGGGGTGQYDQATSKWNAVWTGTPLPAGWSYFNAWVMTGTTEQVRQYMRTLYHNGYK